MLRGKDGSGKLYTPLGTPGYIAPEILLGKPYDGQKIDLFSCAVINYMMFCSLPPFNHAMKSDYYYGWFIKKP